MQFVQTTLTTDQVEQLKVAADMVLQDERYVLSEGEEADYQRLSVFLGTVAQYPSRFAPTGAAAAKVKSIIRRAKGPAQPESARNKRKARQEKRQSVHKRRRTERAEFTAAYNVAQERAEQDRIELEEIQREAEERLAGEPRFNVLTLDGQTLIAGVPKSMIIPAEDPSSLWMSTWTARVPLRPRRPRSYCPGVSRRAMELDAGV